MLNVSIKSHCFSAEGIGFERTRAVCAWVNGQCLQRSHAVALLPLKPSQSFEV